MKKYFLKDIVDIYSGATPLTKNKEYYEGGDIPWITPKDLSGYNHKYIYKGARNITEKGFNSCATSMLPEGTVLFSSRAPIGYVAIAGTKLCTNQGFKSLVCNEKYIYNHYLYYYLIKNKEKLEALGNGSTFKEISRKTLAEYQIELPSIDEQKVIVHDLVNLDEKYDSNCQMMNILESITEGIYCSYFEFNNSSCEKYRLGDIVDIVTGGTPSTKNENYWNNGVYFWYTPSDITATNEIISYGSENKISVSGLTNSNAKLIPKHSVLMTSRATIGEATINMIECTTNQGMLSLVPKDERITSLQLYFWVKRNKKRITSLANGSTFKEIYKKELETMPVLTDIFSSQLYKNDTSNYFNLYQSLVKENKIIQDLKNRILNSSF